MPLATFAATGLALTPAATPTDILVLRGAAGMVVQVIQFRVHIHTTSGTLVLARFVKRSALNTGGTLDTAPVPFSLDSATEAPRAVVDIYTANPAGLGTAVGTFYQYVTTLAPTSVPGMIMLTNVGAAGAMLGSLSADAHHRPVTLRGAAECLALNWAGAALAAGFVIAAWDIVWTERYA